MAVRSILEIDVNDTAFQKFRSQFQAYQDALTKTNGTWDEATKRIDGSRKSFDELVTTAGVRLQRSKMIADAEKVAADHIKRQEDAQKWVTEQTTRQARSWSDMAKNTKSFAANIGHATTSLLRWGTLAGLISGVLGAGGLFGIDRLATSAGNQRRSALGLGVTPGEQSSFEVNLGRIIDPDAVLAGVNQGLRDPRGAVPFGALGLNYAEERQKGTYQASIDAFRAFKQLADRTPEGQLGTTFDARRLGDLGFTKEDFERVKHTPLAETEGYIRKLQADRKSLDLTETQQKAWQDLQVQLTLAGKQIETTFVVGLTKLAGPLGHLSASVVGVIDAFAGSEKLKGFVDGIATDLDQFATKMGSPEFTNSVTSFADDMGKLATNLRADLPGITTFFNAIAALGSGIGAVAGPWINGRAPSREEALLWNKDHPNQQVPVPPEAPPPPFSWLNPGSWLYHSAYRPSVSSSYSGGSVPAAFRTFLPSAAQTDRIARAHDFYRAAGLTENQAAGLLGNIQTESGFNPQAFNPAGGGQGAQGMFQWRGSRIDDFRKMFGHDPRNGTEDEQLMFSLWELTHKEKAALDRLRAYGNTPSRAADIVNRDYERSGTNSAGRAHAAEQYAHKFRDRSVRVQVDNNTGGNANVSVMQLSV